jgi:hypothetical protein
MHAEQSTMRVAMQIRAKPARPKSRNQGGLLPRVLAVEELRILLARHPPPCLSLYLPSRRGGAPEDRNRYAALLEEARTRLVGELGARGADQLLRPLEALSKPAFWKASTAGLALFHCADHSALFRLPLKVPERVFVAESFQVRPLVEFLGTNQHFYLLVLSQGQVSFFKGNATGLAPVDLAPGLRSLEEALGPAERERVKTQHQSSRGGARSIVSGTNVSDSSRDEDLARYFRQIDAALWGILRDEKAPLVLAGPEREVHIFQRVSRYAGLAPRSVHENLAKSNSAELHERVWPIVQEIARASEQRVLEHYQQQVSSGRALDEIRALAQFAVGGRVRELLLDKDAVLYGKMDRANGALELHGKKGGRAEEDVLDDIAEAVLLRGGEVYSLPKELMPTSSPIAGTLRW